MAEPDYKELFWEAMLTLTTIAEGAKKDCPADRHIDEGCEECGAYWCYGTSIGRLLRVYRETGLGAEMDAELGRTPKKAEVGDG